MRNLLLTRTEAEWLVDLLESCDPEKEGTWRRAMAADIRDLFGMATREEETKHRRHHVAEFDSPAPKPK